MELAGPEGKKRSLRGVGLVLALGPQHLAPGKTGESAERERERGRGCAGACMMSFMATTSSHSSAS